MDTQHRHDGGTDGFHYQGNLPHYHDPDSGILVFFDPTPSIPVPDGDRALHEESPLAGAQADLTPAVHPATPGAAAAGSDPRDGDRAGSGRPRDATGRFVASTSLPPRVELRRITPAVVPVSVALEHALIDRDADLFLATQHHRTRMASTVLAAIQFGVEADRLEDALAVYAGMLVRLPSDGGGS